MRECFERFQTNTVPAVPVVSTARGERVAGDGVVAACAVQLGSAPASYAAVSPFGQHVCVDGVFAHLPHLLCSCFLCVRAGVAGYTVTAVQVRAFPVQYPPAVLVLCVSVCASDMRVRALMLQERDVGAAWRASWWRRGRYVLFPCV